MPRRTTPARPLSPSTLAALQPLLTAIARRNRRAREMSAALQIPCSVCTATLATHFNPRNRWIGCRKAGAR